MELKDLFIEDTTSKYAAALAEHGPVSAALFEKDHLGKSRIERVARLLNHHMLPEEDVVDIGCGFGALSVALRGDVGYQGCDSEPSFVKQASDWHPGRKFFVAEFPTYEFVCRDYAALVGVTPHMHPGAGTLMKLSKRVREFTRKGFVFTFHAQEQYRGVFTSYRHDELEGLGGRHLMLSMDPRDSMVAALVLW